MVSVIIPFYNDEYLINEVVRRAVTGIDPKEVEVIVVDDGSFTPLKLAVNYPNVRVVRNQTNMGVGYAFDKGVLKARGDVLLLMGSDVLMQGRSWLKTALNTAKDNPNGITCSVCRGVYLDGDNKVVKRGMSRYGADLLFRVDKDDLPQDSLKRQSAVFADILQAKWTDGREVDSSYDIPCILGAAYVTTREWYTKIGGWGWIKNIDSLSREESKYAGFRRWGGLEPMISLKTWLSGGKCQINPGWTTYHVFDRKEHVTKTRGTQEDKYYFNKLFIAHTLFEKRQTDMLDGHLLDKKNENTARHIIRKNKKSISLEREWMSKIQIHDYTFFEDKFGYDLSWLK